MVGLSAHGQKDLYNDWSRPGSGTFMSWATEGWAEPLANLTQGSLPLTQTL